MRQKVFGLLIWVIGIMALALWGAILWAPAIEQDVRKGAAEALANVAPEADVTLRVSGRDIEIFGIASNGGGTAAIAAALDGVAGRRILRSDLQELPVAAPYVLTAEKNGSIVAKGVIPSEKLRASLAPFLGATAADLVLALGMPEGWDRNALAGLQALAVLEKGRLSVEGQTVILVGEVISARELAQVDAALSAVAMLVKDVAVLDDGLPVAYQLRYNANSGGTLEGKLPFGVTPEAVAAALGLPSLPGTVKTALIKETGDIRYFNVWAEVLDQIQSLSADVSPEARLVQASLKPGADQAAVAAALATGGFVVDVTPAPAPVPAPASTLEPTPGALPQPRQALAIESRRAPLATATPILDKVVPAISPLGFEITPKGCQTATDVLLAETTILFLPNSDQLDDSATLVLASLAAIAKDCAGGGLFAEIGGHTDTSGDADENMALSARRAETVRAALAAAGVGQSQLATKGYGPTQPITENETAEGRAKNRRTTMRWSQSPQQGG